MFPNKKIFEPRYLLFCVPKSGLGEGTCRIGLSLFFWSFVLFLVFTFLTLSHAVVSIPSL